MTSTYHAQFQVTDEFLDENHQLKTSALLYFVQEVSGQHATVLGTGWDALQEKHLFWAIIRHRVRITRLPMAGETVTLETWPMPTTRVAYPRATVAYDEDGCELFRTTALWVLMDTETRAMVLPARSGVTVEGILTGNELEAPGSLSPKELSQTVPHQVTEAELDRNQHMNNTRYMDWIDSLLLGDFRKEHPMQEFTVCYLSEARKGQSLELCWELSGEQVLSVEVQRPKDDESGKTERIFAAGVVFS